MEDKRPFVTRHTCTLLLPDIGGTAIWQPSRVESMTQGHICRPPLDQLTASLTRVCTFLVEIYLNVVKQLFAFRRVQPHASNSGLSRRAVRSGEACDPLLPQDHYDEGRALFLLHQV